MLNLPLTLFYKETTASCLLLFILLPLYDSSRSYFWLKKREGRKKMMCTCEVLPVGKGSPEKPLGRDKLFEQ
jgi:hypothetical protein